jgi:hypothetical protein
MVLLLLKQELVDIAMNLRRTVHARWLSNRLKIKEQKSYQFTEKQPSE